MEENFKKNSIVDPGDEQVEDDDDVDVLEAVDAEDSDEDSEEGWAEDYTGEDDW